MMAVPTMHSAFLVAVTSFLLIIKSANSQISYGSLGRGLLNSGYLQTGGLVYPNTDGSGPQADSLAAAIYGVAVPPGFNQFSASENYFGQNRGDAYTDSFGGVGTSAAAKPSDLLLGTGIHTGGSGRGGSHSTFISDFSAFGDFGSHSSNDQKSSSSSLIEIDPIAARFGVVIPNVGHAPFDPSLSGSTEPFGGGTSTGVGDGTKDLFNISPVETSIKFDLPTQATLRDASLFSSQPNTDVNSISPVFSNQNALPRIDDSFSGDPTITGNASPPGVGNAEKNQADVITNAYKFSDNQIIKLEEIKRNFQHTTAVNDGVSGKLLSGLSTAQASTPESTERDTNVELISVKEKNSQLQAVVTSNLKELKQKTSNEGTLPYAKSSSPYVYRGPHREQQKVEQLKKDTVVTDAPENIPAAEYLTAPESKRESISDHTKEPTAEHSNSYSFLTAPGYRTYHK
ncbi:uncharacterized protein LOC130686113 [Daphnia carinata]|uniref:uncharacterized protein LOC130686113 n=1 Tax=Daphnia carinata TaxID=120202 RepID=UPI00257A4864|nr:uncharacterized protein LOC130686113 [Daphnia carinata]